MNHPEATAEVYSLVYAWRMRATTLALSLLALIVLPILVAILNSINVELPWSLRWTGVAAFLFLLLAIWRRDWHLYWRVLVFSVPAYGLAVMQLMLAGLAGSGRVTLITLPLLALVMAGARAGWLAAGLSVAVYGVFTDLAGAGLLTDKFVIRLNTTEPSFWVIQGVMWLAAMIPLMFLATRFQAMQLKILVEERHARREIEAAAATRRRLEDEVTRISETEQRRMGSELHNGLCQQLTAALLECSALEKDLTARKASESQSARRLRRLLEAGLGEAYDAARGLCPVDMDPKSLAPALERLGRQTQKDSDLICEIRVEEGRSGLTSVAALNLYRIAQEAVNNAVKHAHCQRIIVELASTPEAAHLRVMDDGRPVKNQPPNPAGLGIPIMKYRAEMIGGRLWIERTPAGGMEVNCRVACAPTAARGYLPRHQPAGAEKISTS
jgi:signal transduction histidine kinase